MIEYKLKKKLIYNKNSELINSLKSRKNLNHLSESTIEILTNRGISTEEEILHFLFDGKESYLDTSLMKDADKATNIIIDCLINNYEIVNISDYDADGCLSSTVLIRALKNLGANIKYYTNNRFIDGYGIQPNSVDNVLKLYPNTKLIITTDNGIVAYKGVQRAKDLGLQIIVTDHHEPGDTLPNADAICNPKRKDCNYPFKHLCGTGVIFKLMLYLYYRLNKNLDFIYNLADFVSLATIGDVVPLIGENRAIVREGFKLANEGFHDVFKILKEKTEIDTINSYTYGFVFCPIINALGRLEGSAMDAIQMFTTDDISKISSLSDNLIILNEERKIITKQQEELAESILEKQGLSEVIVIYDKSFHEGVVGLIAGRLKEKYNRPVVVLTSHNNILKGSARSIDNFHIKEIFDILHEDLLGYGGHAKAGGLSLKLENLDKFKEHLIKIAKDKLSEEDFKKNLIIDSVLDANNIDNNTVENIELLEPFGEGFPKPLYGLKNFVGKNYSFIGSDEQHLKIKGNITLLGWNLAKYYNLLGCPSKIKALGSPQLNYFNNLITTQFIVDSDNIFRY